MTGAWEFPIVLGLAAGVLVVVIGGWVLVEHILNPTSEGIEDPDVTTRLKGSCGETMQVSLEVRKGVIRRASYYTDGCGPVSACGAAATRMALGKDLEEAAQTVDGEAVARAVGGLPEDKRHCADLAAETLVAAVLEYLRTTRKAPSKGV